MSSVGFYNPSWATSIDPSWTSALSTGLSPAVTTAAPALAGATSGLGAAAGGAGGMLSMLGGPVGMAASAGLGFLSSGFGNIATKNQMEAQLQAQVDQDKRDDVSNLAFTRAFQRGNTADQMQALQDTNTARKIGLGRPEAFQAFLSARMPAAAARRESFFNV